MDNEIIRCGWAEGSDLYRKYHDEEWGRPSHDESHLFEMLILEGQQAGLSWITILNKRESFRLAFDGFNPESIAAYGESKVAELMDNSAIIRNRRKIAAAIGNARAYLDMRSKGETLDSFLWRYVDGTPVMNHFETPGDVPAATPLAEKISRNMKKLGFSFVGPVIVYSLMQSVGMVNDHLESCGFKYV